MKIDSGGNISMQQRTKWNTGGVGVRLAKWSQDFLHWSVSGSTATGEWNRTKRKGSGLTPTALTGINV